MVSKQSVQEIKLILIEELGRTKTQKLLNRLYCEVNGNLSYRQTLTALLKEFKP
jgi:hypothetical protein